jgi:Sulfotransferase domain
LKRGENLDQELHPFILNTIPKSGTHLLKQLLLGMNPNVITNNPHHVLYGAPEFNKNEDIERLNHMEANQFIHGHFYYMHFWKDLFDKNDLKQIFLIRDLRDIVLSYSYFIDKLPNHPLFKSFYENQTSTQDRCLTLINGMTDPKLNLVYPSIDTWFGSFQGWMELSNVLTVKYEDLNPSHPACDETLERIIAFLWEDGPMPMNKDEMIKQMIQSINPKSSPTFRKGKSGGWMNEFDKRCKHAFKERAGQILIDLGYEHDMEW